jgi:hypothetical protein
MYTFEVKIRLAGRVSYVEVTASDSAHARMLISDDETKLYSQFGSRVRDVPRSGRVQRSGADEAFPWSRWFPKED